LKGKKGGGLREQVQNQGNLTALPATDGRQGCIEMRGEKNCDFIGGRTWDRGRKFNSFTRVDHHKGCVLVLCTEGRSKKKF